MVRFGLSKISRALPLLALFTLTACNDELYEANAPLSYAPMLVKFSDAGVGPLNPETRYAKTEIAGAMPNFDLDVVKTINEGELHWVMAAFKDGMQALQIFPNSGKKSIKYIHGVGDSVGGPNGERLTMLFRDTPTKIDACKPGTRQWSGMAICRAAGQKRTFLLFSYSGYSGSLGSLPPRNVLEQASLQRIIWRAN